MAGRYHGLKDLLARLACDLGRGWQAILEARRQLHGLLLLVFTHYVHGQASRTSRDVTLLLPGTLMDATSLGYIFS